MPAVWFSGAPMMHGAPAGWATFMPLAAAGPVSSPARWHVVSARRAVDARRLAARQRRPVAQYLVTVGRGTQSLAIGVTMAA